MTEVQTNRELIDPLESYLESIGTAESELLLVALRDIQRNRTNDDAFSLLPVSVRPSSASAAKSQLSGQVIAFPKAL